MKTTDHFEKHKNSREKADWNFNILFNDQPQVAKYIANYDFLLKHPGLYNHVPKQWLHATILRVGYYEDFTEKEMLETAENLKPKLAKLKMPEFIFKQNWDGEDNPCVHFAPREPLDEMFNIIVEELTSSFGKERLPKKMQFFPHITFAYSSIFHGSSWYPNCHVFYPVLLISR